MKLHQSNTSGLNQFTHIDRASFGINDHRYSGNIVVLPEKVIQNWTTATLETISGADFEFIASIDIDIILLGTGPTLRFPPRQLMVPLYRLGRGIEVMDTPAACRTFNILCAEGRRVGAFLLAE